MSKLTNPRIALYKEAMSMEERRASLQAELDRVMARLSAIKADLFDNDGFMSTTRAVSGSVHGKGGGRARRGELKAQVLRALVAAGSAGARVKDIAATLGAKAGNIHSWFQSAAKRLPQIKKVGAGRYRVEGALPAAELDAPRAKVAVKRGRRGKASKSTRPLSGRGKLAEKILGVLKEGGADGAKIADIAGKLGVKNRNLFIWFSTTGRKNSAIKKIGPGHYRLEK